ncbi:MAG: hypothetical protein GX137_06650 [Thermoplasmatales archaeon]|nr:hypothetical protein [Thermoplasmatales archaeon]
MQIVESEIECMAFWKGRFSCFMIRKAHPASGCVAGGACFAGPSVSMTSSS